MSLRKIKFGNKEQQQFSTNPSFLLTFFDDAFQACLCLLSSHA